MINEAIVTTLNEDNSVHIVPLGVKRHDDYFLLAPFKPSTTLANLERTTQAVVNMTDDVSIFAGCLTGHYHWPTVPTKVVQGARLVAALSHIEVEVIRKEDDELRPVYYCLERNSEIHAPFMGLNRAKAAVLEAAILVSHLNLLPKEKIDSEMAYLQIAVDKTAGENELRAWGWIQQRIKDMNRSPLDD